MELDEEELLKLHSTSNYYSVKLRYKLVNYVHDNRKTISSDLIHKISDICRGYADLSNDVFDLLTKELK